MKASRSFGVRASGVMAVAPGFAACALGIVAVALPARAETPDSLYERGVALRKNAQDAEALEIFKRLDELQPSARTTAQIGLAEQALGAWLEAEVHVGAALKSDDDPWIKKNRVVLETALEKIRSRLGSLTIWGEPRGARVLLDGKQVGTLPMSAPVRVVAGTTVSVTVRAPGYVERTTRLTVDPGGTARERIVLEPEAQAPALVAAEPQRALRPNDVERRADEAERPAREATAVVTQGGAADASSPLPSGLRSGAKWIAWGGGAVALGLGTWGAVRQNSAGNTFDAGCGLDATGTPQPIAGSSRTHAGCVDLKGNVDSAYRLEVVGLATGAALVATGAILWLTEPRAAEAGKTALACAPAVERHAAPSIACAVRF